MDVAFPAYDGGIDLLVYKESDLNKDSNEAEESCFTFLSKVHPPSGVG